MSVVKLFWWQRGPKFGNFGDELSPWIVERLSGQQVIHSSLERAELVAIGSLLEPHLVPKAAWSTYRGSIWGSGRMFANGIVDLAAAQVTALRGRHTHAGVGISSSSEPVLGDPGLLVSDLIDRQPASMTLGILPHWSERQHFFFRSRICQERSVEVIDPCAPVGEILQRLSRCQYILSSAMHGLIVADALGIPNRWLRMNTGREQIHGYPEFKYLDYYSGWGAVPPQPWTPNRQVEFRHLISTFTELKNSQLESVKVQLRRVFPFHR